MPTPTTELKRETVGQRGREVYDRLVRPQLLPEDEGKYVAVDVETGEYEIDSDDYTANMKLMARCPAERIWLERAGYPTAYKIRRGGSPQ